MTHEEFNECINEAGRRAREAEREACAKEVESFGGDAVQRGNVGELAGKHNRLIRDIAQAIRNRTEGT